MRVLFVAYAEKTHFLGMVPTAWALRTAGHEVRVASQPALADAITGAGLTAVPVGTDHKMWKVADRFLKSRFAELNPEFAKAMRASTLPPFEVADTPTEELTWQGLKDGYDEVIKAYKMANETMIDELVEYARSWRPDLVIWEPMTFAAPIAAKAVGAAHGRLLWSLDAFGRMRRHFLRLNAERPVADRVDPLADWLSEEGVRFGVEFSEDLTCGQFTIDQYPDSVRMEADLHYVPVRYVPYNGPAVVPRWLWEPPERPRIALTLGVSATERFGGYAVGLQDILDSLADLDVEVVATVAEEGRQKLERIPENTRIVPFVPLHALVPTCSAVIHHAGFGTINTTSLHGIPQVTMPENDDAPLVASRIAERGAGLTMRMSEATGAKVAESVARLLAEPSFRAGAARLRDEFRALPSPRDAVPELEQLTHKYRRESA
ncbi:activator-dependent family glycosyltransferase [Amycolatopsis anabasis]|uniref:activator-dependent family glycosyltransferase n=1 Tax=Amycolatopsis anabasis TaxID=1840409 RepID=UPI00131BE460|nr:activator-dependent family glycosyltransferase [Amycolatopsis anabasis]